MGFFSKSSSSSKPSAPTPQTAPRKEVHHHYHSGPAQSAPQSGGAMSGIGGAIASGMAVGAGAAVGREAANYAMGTGKYSEQSNQGHAPQQAPQ